MNWAEVLRIGLTELRLPPERLWAMTPAELRIMAGLAAAPDWVDRAALDGLCAKFPDKGGTADG
ncbi:rcc01693 family protein [Oceanomicrobium pacificus]|uniref:Phage tail assembly chaperone n=1 Tax=Oceanomicrobium pacificus TaxID=2692916 RepID=A0A6B0TNY9_9RHOB|nr:rcc01693 family protein [Oceanomicrobium pacificus]MXU66320.1 phage tail assembly chaperone [Oceanomicrobium pacificus]